MDQVYFLDQKNELDLEIDRYSPYYSDNDAILITLSQSKYHPDPLDDTLMQPKSSLDIT